MSSDANNYNNKRTAIRHECVDLFVSFGDIRSKVYDLGLNGFSIHTSSELDNKDSRAAIFSDGENSSFRIDSAYVVTTETDKGFRHHYRFINPQRPEKLGWLNRHLSRPFVCVNSVLELAYNQRKLADTDLATLTNVIQNLKDRQFQLILAAIPILFGLIAAIVEFMADGISNPVRDFYYVIPPTTTVLSILFLAVFIQKMESIRRTTAFTLILQRHLVMGSFPRCYRGWYDAYENYNHLVRHGAEPPFIVEKFREKKFEHFVPANSFNMLGIGLLSSISLVSLCLMLYLAYLQLESGEVGLTSYTSVVLGVGALFAYSAVVFVTKYVALTRGDRSFRYLVVVFSKILKYAPPFDPYNNDHLKTHSKQSDSDAWI